MSAMLEKAYRRVSERHGGLTREHLLMHCRSEVHAEIDLIALEYLLIYIAAIISLFVFGALLGSIVRAVQ